MNVVLRFCSLMRRDIKTVMSKIVYEVTLSAGNRAPLLRSPERDKGCRELGRPFNVSDQEAFGESAVVFIAVDSASTSTASSTAHLTSGVTDERFV